MKQLLKKLLDINSNENNRNNWLLDILSTIPSGHRILDAGAGELRNKPLCAHLNYVSQDICQYEGSGDTKGLQTGAWDTSQIDIVCDITAIPEENGSFDIILCSEVFEHLSDPLKALDEFARLLKPGGKLIITAPFASLVHFAPYHYSTGFSRYWYEHHFPLRNLEIEVLISNGDWFDFAKQEMLRLPSVAQSYKDWCWPLAYLVAGFGLLYFSLRGKTKKADDLACLGWHCVAVKR
ncbi:MAG: methyltransferase domain-containing protein [Methylococcaceae bacterium]